MSANISTRWDSQPLAAWTARFAEGELVTLEGLQTHFLARGEGKPLILLHGFFFDSTLWHHNLDALARAHHVYTMDLWGFGYSARTEEQPSYALYSRQLAAFMAALGIERASLAGQSLGGGVVIQFAVDHPDRVDKLVLIDSAGMRNPEPLAARLLALPGVGEAMFNFPGDALRRKMLKDFFLYRSGALAPETYRCLTRAHKIEGSTASALAFMRGQFADKLEDLLPRLSALSIPVQIVWGAQDRAIPLALGRRMHQALPGSILSVIPEAGHVPNLEQPERFNAAVGAFLRDDCPSSPPGTPHNATGAQHG